NYFLTKQILMGVVFARFAIKAGRSNFTVTPNVLYNSDGYWGLGWLRKLMIYTYVAAIGQFFAYLGIFLVWLPIDRSSLLGAALCLVFAYVIVLYPSALAYFGTVRSSERIARHVIASSSSESSVTLTSLYSVLASNSERYRATRKSLEDVWSIRSLPF